MFVAPKYSDRYVMIEVDQFSTTPLLDVATLFIVLGALASMFHPNFEGDEPPRL